MLERLRLFPVKSHPMYHGRNEPKRRSSQSWLASWRYAQKAKAAKAGAFAYVQKQGYQGACTVQ
jgi:hypothetical protein